MERSPQQVATSIDALTQLLAEEIARGKNWSEKHRRWWSVITHTASALVIGLSCFASILAQSYPPITAGLATVVAAIAAAQLAFRQKWATYRLVHTNLRFLEIDLLSGYRQVAEVRKALEEVYKQHDSAVLAASGLLINGDPNDR